MATGDHKAVVTPEMIEAGVVAYVESSRQYPSDFAINGETVRLIYTAMRSKAQHCDCKDGE